MDLERERPCNIQGIGEGEAIVRWTDGYCVPRCMGTLYLVNSGQNFYSGDFFYLSIRFPVLHFHRQAEVVRY